MDHTTPNGTITNTESNPSKPITMPASRKLKLQQMLWHSLMECKGEIVAVTKTNGDTYSGVLFAIEAADDADDMCSAPNGDNTTASSSSSMSNAAWKYIVLKYVQKMDDPNRNPSDRIKVTFEEEMKIPASDFAALSAINITDHTNTYRRSDRQAFNDATGRTLHRKERELVRWKASNDGDDITETLDDNIESNEAYDQFETNKAQFNIEATFDENVYTSNIDKKDPEYQRRLKNAQLEEEGIMNQPTNNKHVRDDRAYFKQNKQNHNSYNEADADRGDEDEEDVYSRVLHPASLSKQNLKESKKRHSYIPPQLRKASPQNQNKGPNKKKHKPQQRRPPINKTQNQHNQANNNNNNSNNNALQAAQHQLLQLQAAQAAQAQVAVQQQLANTANVFGLPPHIAKIVQSVQSVQSFQNPLLTQQQQQQQSSQAHQSNQSLLSNTSASNTTQQNNALSNTTNNSNITSEENATMNNNGEGAQQSNNLDDAASLNPHAIEFTPQVPSHQKPNTDTHAHQSNSGSIANHNLATQLIQQQQQQPTTAAQLIQQQHQQQLGQYNFNPVTQQYVLNPFAQQPQQQLQQLAIQQQQQNAYLQQLAIQQAAHAQAQAQAHAQAQQLHNTHQIQPDPTANLQQQQMLAQQQLLAHQQQLQLHAAPLFNPTNLLPQQNQASNQAHQQLLAQQQQAQFLQQQQLQQQQYLTQFAQPQQQFFMQNLMPQ